MPVDADFGNLHHIMDSKKDYWFKKSCAMSNSITGLVILPAKRWVSVVCGFAGTIWLILFLLMMTGRMPLNFFLYYFFALTVFFGFSALFKTDYANH
jgi:hypothetical protein